MNQVLDFVTAPRNQGNGRRLYQRNCRRSRWTADGGRDRNRVNGVEREDYALLMVEHGIMAILMMPSDVHAQVPVDQEVLVAVFFGLMDVLRRDDREHPNRQRKHKRENGTPGHEVPS